MAKSNKRLLSMTGFGRAKIENNKSEVLCEIRSVNHRGLDVKFRVPRTLLPFESEFHKDIQSLFARGRVDVFMEVTDQESEGKSVQFNHKRATQMLEHLSKFQKQHKAVSADVAMGDLLRTHDLFTFGEAELNHKNIHALARRALGEAMKDAIAARHEEGQRLHKIVEHSLVQCERLVKEIATRLEGSSQKHYKDLRKRIAEITVTLELDEMRMAQEVAHIVERADVAEEINRLGAHLSHFRGLCEAGGAAGRKLDFLCQEMFREANTASSKITGTTTTYLVVDLKSEIERIREQIQNIE